MNGITPPTESRSKLDSAWYLLEKQMHRLLWQPLLVDLSGNLYLTLYRESHFTKLQNVYTQQAANRWAVFFLGIR